MFTTTGTLDDHVNGVLTSHHRKVILPEVLFDKMVRWVREAVKVFDEWSRLVVDDCAVMSPGDPLHVVHASFLIYRCDEVHKGLLSFPSYDIIDLRVVLEGFLRGIGKMHTPNDRDDVIVYFFY